MRTLNTEVERIATTKGNNVHFVDMYNAVSKSDLPDNVHPNNNGYAKMAQKWFDETKDAVKNMIPIAFIPDTSVAYDGMTSLKYHPYYVPYYTLLSYEIFSRGTIPVEENTNYTLTMMLKVIKCLTSNQNSRLLGGMYSSQTLLWLDLNGDNTR